MIWLLIAVVLILLILALLITNKKQSSGFQYRKQKTLFSPAERSFLGVLNQAIEENAVIFGKVRVADILSPTNGLSRSVWQSSFNKISSKHFDFIVCDKHDLSILCAIELDDKSHNSKTRKTRDAFLQSACTSAHLPLIQMPAKATYNIDEIRHLLLTKLSGNNNT